MCDEGLLAQLVVANHVVPLPCSLFVACMQAALFDTQNYDVKHAGKPVNKIHPYSSSATDALLPLVGPTRAVELGHNDFFVELS